MKIVLYNMNERVTLSLYTVSKKNDGSEGEFKVSFDDDGLGTYTVTIDIDNPLMYVTVLDLVKVIVNL